MSELKQENSMKLLMTTAEIARTAFGGNIAADAIGDSAVIAAQLRYLKPVLGNSFYKAVEEGKYERFVEEWIKPALALFVKYMVLPSVAFRIAELGVVRFEGDFFHAASSEDISRLRRVAKSDARTALAAAVEHVESSPASYPEYDVRRNIRRRISVEGGIVM